MGQGCKFCKTKLPYKIILDLPEHSSTTDHDALQTLNWFNLNKSRMCHGCLYVLKCKNGLSKSHLGTFNLIARCALIQYWKCKGIPARLSAVKTNWGKQRLLFHTVH